MRSGFRLGPRLYAYNTSFQVTVIPVNYLPHIPTIYESCILIGTIINLGNMTCPSQGSLSVSGRHDSDCGSPVRLRGMVGWIHGNSRQSSHSPWDRSACTLGPK